MMEPELHPQMRKVIRQVHINMPWLHLPRHLDMVLEYGFHLEIGLGGIDLDGLSPIEAERTVSRLHAAGIRLSLHGPFWDLCPGSTDPLIRQVTRTRLQQLFELIPVFNPVQVVCHTGYDPRHHGEDWHRFLELSLATWDPILERAQSLEVPLLLENVWEYGPQLHQALFARLPSPYLGFCLDVGHQHSFSRTPLMDWLAALTEQLREIHLHDNHGSGDSHLPLGQGNIDFHSLFQFIKERRAEPLLTLEPHRERHVFESLRALTEILERSGILCEEADHGDCGNQHRSHRAPDHQSQSLCGEGSDCSAEESAPV
jgi:sugar phosphate isomerase/epimerase